MTRSRDLKREAGRTLLHDIAAGDLGHPGDLHLTARTLAKGLYHGRHRTPDRGASTEFYDYRAYTPGDPTQRVDWRLFGRTDRLFVRRFHQDTQLSLLLVVDGTASMDFAGLKPRPGQATKFRRACEIAAALAYLAIRQGDRAGLILLGAMTPDRRRLLQQRSGRTASEQIAEEPLVLPIGAGWPSLHRVIGALDRASPMSARSGEQPALTAGLLAAQGLMRDRGLIVAIGDGLEDRNQLLDAAAQLRFGGATGGGTHRRGSEVSFIQILTRDELQLSTRDAANFVDAESAHHVQTHLAQVGDRYRQLIHEHVAALQAGFLGLGGRAMLATTEAPAIDVLRRFVAGGAA